MKYFEYGIEEIEYLRKKDKALKKVIDQVGMIAREVNLDLFDSLVDTILSQQISTKAAITVRTRLLDQVKQITPETMMKVSEETLRGCGISARKIHYIKELAHRVYHGELDLESLKQKSNQEVIDELVQLPGIGIWSAEMFLLFSLERKDIVSYHDYIIQKGMRMVYHHRKITKDLFLKYKKRYGPYGSIASFYLWQVGNGKVEGYQDYAPKSK